jgi:hypothetical protein
MSKVIVKVELDLSTSTQPRTIIDDGDFIGAEVIDEVPTFWYVADSENEKHSAKFQLNFEGDVPERVIVHSLMFVYDEDGNIKHRLFLLEHLDPNDEYTPL